MAWVRTPQAQTGAMAEIDGRAAEIFLRPINSPGYFSFLSFEPLPCRLDDRVQAGILRAPSQLLLQARGIGHQLRRIAIAPRPDYIRYLLARDLLHRVQDFLHRKSFTGAGVELARLERLRFSAFTAAM